MEQQKLPNITMSIILSIAGLLCCCVFGLGVIPSGIGYFLVGKDGKLVASNPGMYSNESVLKTAKIIAIISLVANVLFIIYMIYSISTIGFGEFVRQLDTAIEQGSGGY